MDALSKIAAMIMAAVLLTFFPLQYLLGHQLLLIHDYVKNTTEQFNNEIREKGYIDVGMYETFLKKLSKPKLRYHIEIEHAMPIEGTDVTSVGESSGAMVASNSLINLPDLMGAPPEQEETSGSIRILAAHIHTSDCYVGHNHVANGCSYHTHSGSATSEGGCYGLPNYHSHSSSCYGNGPCNTWSSVSKVSSGYYYCRTCKKNVLVAEYRNYCPNCYGINDTVGVRACGHGNSIPSSRLCTASVRKLICTISTSVPVSYGLNCGKNEGYQCGYSNDYNPICNTVVSSITATYPSQTVDKGGSIIITATATYLDGHMGTINCTSNFNPNQVGTQTVTLTYSGLVGNARTTGTRACTVSVTVRETNIPASLSVTPSVTTVYNDMEPAYTVMVNYVNNTTKTLTSSQYTKTGWTTGPGTKIITFSYTENSKTVTKSVTITVLPNVSSLSVTPSSAIVYNGIEPSYTVVVTYEDNSTKTLGLSQYIKTGWTTGAGTKNVAFSYSENNRTITKSVAITVKPNLSLIRVLPTAHSVARYNNLSFTVTAVYENNSFAVVTGYTVSGFNNNTIGDQIVTVSYTENGITKTASVKVTVTLMTRICPICGTLYYLDGNDFDPGCPACGTTVAYIHVAPEYIEVQKNTSFPVTVTATYMDGHTAAVTGWTSNYNPEQTGLQMVTVAYQDRSAQVWVNVLSTKKCPVCGTEYILGNDGTDPSCPVCKSAVVSISVSPASQNVKRGDELHLTITALYRDGHSAAITGWESDFNNSKPGTQVVTVFYHNKSCTVNVTVISEFMRTCNICGYTYNFRDFPFGCPICTNFLESINAVLKNGGIRTPFGKPLNLAVVLTYRDRHKLQAFNGWTDNFDPFTLGPQTVTVRYTDIYGNIVSCSLTVEVVNRGEAVICEAGHLYYPEETGGVCPYCAMLSGKEMEGLYNCTFTNEILDTLNTDGIYRFRSGDYVTVKVTIDIKGSIYSFGLFGRKEDRKEISYGGEVA